MKTCTKCVMDESDTDIIFNRDGICNHCISASAVIDNFTFEANDFSDLNELFSSIETGRSKYDCVIGLSGGVDSSYVALLAHKAGLNPLCVHFDNGWNSVIAVRNIKNIVDKTGWDYQSFVINWPEFRSLQRAYLKAGVIDIEVCTDHAIFATMLAIAKKEKIKVVLSGTNFATEHGMPMSWTWHKLDRVNLKDINRCHGDRKLREYPTISTFYWLIMRKFGYGLKFLEPLNSMQFDIKKAIAELKAEFGWEEYGGKHHESVFTKVYQTIILPQKFNVDKRKVHFSALIRTGQISRDEALGALREPFYNNEADLERDMHYVSKKLGFSNEEFSEILNAPIRHHSFYKTDRVFIEPLLKLARRLGFRSFYQK